MSKGLTGGSAWYRGSRGNGAAIVHVVWTHPAESDSASVKMRAMLRPMIALGCVGRGAEIASLVAYLGRPVASFIIESAVTVDGGYLA